MTLTEKLESIAEWTMKNVSRETNHLRRANVGSTIASIEEMIEETLPEEFREVYHQVNGETGESGGVFFGNGFMSTEEIIGQLEFGLSLKKPPERRVIDKEASDRKLGEIAELYFKSIPAKKSFGLFSKKRAKAEFECSAESYSGLTIDYENGDSETALLDKQFSDRVFKLSRELHEMERLSYNWDSLQFTLFYDGDYSVERADFNWDEDFDFSSCPEAAIKKKYFNYKWIPIFQDYGGNYIGIDLDPDKKGRKGQIITFGRDEEDMVVLANDLSGLFDMSIKEMTENPDRFLAEKHLHEVLKEVRNCA